MRKALFALALVGLLIVAGVGSVAAQPADPVQIRRVAFPITLADNQAATVVGYVYVRPDLRSPNCASRRRTVQVLVAGATYNHRYWDAGVINGNDYSYARFMASQCYTVLALDRLGTGESSRPAGDLVTKATEASALAQILRQLRASGAFSHIVLVGHSFGTLLATYTLGTYGNVADAFVATGWVNAPGVVPVDPAYIQSLFATPYITLPPEVRTALFYDAANADPIVIAFDNANLADTFTRGFLADAVAVFTARALGDVDQIKALTKVDQIGVPMFVQLGANDALFPASYAAVETQFYSGAPNVTVDTLSNIGHSFNLHTNHQAGWDHIAAWIGSTFGN